MLGRVSDIWWVAGMGRGWSWRVEIESWRVERKSWLAERESWRVELESSFVKNPK